MEREIERRKKRGKNGRRERGRKREGEGGGRKRDKGKGEWTEWTERQMIGSERRGVETEGKNHIEIGLHTTGM